METQSSIETVTHPHLRSLLQDLEGVAAEARGLRERLSDAQSSWQPAPGAWNVLECLQHLIIADELYFPVLRTAIEQADREQAEAAFKPSFFARKFFGFVAPESKRKIKTSAPFVPEAALDDVTVFQQFEEHEQVFAALIRQADGVHLNGKKFPSPASRLVRFTIGEALTMLVTHQRRHIQQARRVTEHPGFPTA